MTAIPAEPRGAAEWASFRAAKLAFERAPGDDTAAAVLATWEPWWDAFIGPNDPSKPLSRAAIQAGLAAHLPRKAA